MGTQSVEGKSEAAMNTSEYNALLHMVKEVAIESRKIEISVTNINRTLDDYIDNIHRQRVLNQQREL